MLISIKQPMLIRTFMMNWWNHIMGVTSVAAVHKACHDDKQVERCVFIVRADRYLCVPEEQAL